MAFSLNTNMAPVMRSLLVNGTRGCLRPAMASSYSTSSLLSSKTPATQQTPIFSVAKPTIGASPSFTIGQLAARPMHTTATRSSTGAPVTGSGPLRLDKPIPLTEVLDREIQEETAELNQRLQSDQFPGFSVETDGADVKLTKQVGDSTVTVRFTVSSSLNEWRNADVEPEDKKNPEEPDTSYSLISLPDFQVQITRDKRTLEVSCYFEELEHDEETGEAYPMEPTFNIDELVIYESEPRESEFAVSAEYFREELQEGLIQYLADHGIDDEFVKNLVSYSTSYEKKQYIGLMKRLREFVSN